MAVEAAAIGTRPATQPLSRTVIAATVGNVLEWFDFLVYGYFAVTIAGFVGASFQSSLAAGLRSAPPRSPSRARQLV